MRELWTRQALKMSVLGFLALRLTVVTQAESQATKAFHSKVNEYVQLQKKVSATVPPLTKTESDPGKIAAHIRSVAQGIQHARANAKQGDIFVPESVPEFRQIIRGELEGKQGAASRQTVKTGNPAEEPDSTAKVVLAVNQPYPDRAPLSSVPPGLLLKLPQLPKELEYRFLGRNLILLDATSNLIVDYLLDVVPKA
jgi:hypothetical protein